MHRYLIVGCLFLGAGGGFTGATDSVPPGFLEGHLKVMSAKPVELAEAGPSKKADESYDYAEYPLIVFSRNAHKEVARFAAGPDGNYRVALPPGDYILDVQGRAPGHVRAKPQHFTVLSNQSVRVDMDIDTGVR